MHSFDVESLFTNVPLQEARDVIQKRLEEDDTLPDRTTLPVNAIVELINLCMETTYFRVGDQFYKQNQGMPMGSPISPIVSNIYMEFFEQLAISTALKKPTLWLRYIDDTFILWDEDISELNKFFEHLNSLKPTIKFTKESEDNGVLPFLDVLVMRRMNSVETTVYRKPTHTGRYLNYLSNHPSFTKLSVAKSLLKRAELHCSNNSLLKNELYSIRETLHFNNFPPHVFTKISKEMKNSKKPVVRQFTDTKCLQVIPYIRGFSEKVKRISSKYNILTSFQTVNTIKEKLVKTKPENKIDTKNCIYQIPCECGQSYIGETKRPLVTRLSEHKRHTLRGETDKSGVANHCWEFHHRMQWEDTKILCKEVNLHKRKFKEATYILNNNDIFSNPSYEVNGTWNEVLSQHAKL